MKTNMKSYIIPALAALTSLTACNGFLDLSDPNAVTVGNYYQSESDIEQSVNGVYAVLKDGYVLGTGAAFFEENKARILVYPDTGVNGGENAQFDNCTVQSNNSFVLSRWNSLYKCIDRANVVLKHIDDISYSSDAKRSTYEAEVRFVRALCYYMLVTDYGAVPLVLEKLTTLGAVNEANVRTPKDQVYQAIFDDCKFVTESSLPDLQGASGCGRASKVAAMTLWGKAALQMATDEDFASQKSTLCATAITELEAAWAKKPFADFTTLGVEEAFDVDSQATAKENIFQLCFIGGASGANSSYNTNYRPTNIDDPDKEVNFTASSGSEFMPYNTTLAIWDEAGDERFDKLMAKGSHKGAETYYTLKFRDLDPSGYYGCNFIVFRYADVVLMLAEAAYHKGDAPSAQTWLNLVRQRAGLAATDVTGTALRDAIYHEREREFAYEFKAWSDRKRGYTKAEIRAIMAADGATEYDDTDYLLPIPHTQWLLNPTGLTQNPGYTD